MAAGSLGALGRPFVLLLLALAYGAWAQSVEECPPSDEMVMLQLLKHQRPAAASSTLAGRPGGAVGQADENGLGCLWSGRLGGLAAKLSESLQGDPELLRRAVADLGLELPSGVDEVVAHLRAGPPLNTSRSMKNLQGDDDSSKLQLTGAALSKWLKDKDGADIYGAIGDTFGDFAESIGLSLRAGTPPDWSGVAKIALIDTAAGILIAVASAVNPLLGILATVLFNLIRGATSGEETDVGAIIMKQLREEMDVNFLRSTLSVFRGDLEAITEEIQWVPEMLSSTGSGAAAGNEKLVLLTYNIGVSTHLAIVRRRLWKDDCETFSPFMAASTAQVDCVKWFRAGIIEPALSASTTLKAIYLEMVRLEPSYGPSLWKRFVQLSTEDFAAARKAFVHQASVTARHVLDGPLDWEGWWGSTSPPTTNGWPQKLFDRVARVTEQLYSSLRSRLQSLQALAAPDDEALPVALRCGTPLCKDSFCARVRTVSAQAPVELLVGFYIHNLKVHLRNDPHAFGGLGAQVYLMATDVRQALGLMAWAEPLGSSWLRTTSTWAPINGHQAACQKDYYVSGITIDSLDDITQNSAVAWSKITALHCSRILDTKHTDCEWVDWRAAADQEGPTWAMCQPGAYLQGWTVFGDKLASIGCCRATTDTDVSYNVDNQDQDTEEFNPPEEMRSYSHAQNNSLPGYGFARSRLDSPLAWSAQILDGTEWMIMDFGAPRVVAAIVVQGSADASASQWVSEYRVEFSNGVQRSDEGFTWTTVMASVSGTEAFAGPTSKNDRFEAKLKQATKGRYWRITPRIWTQHPSIRVGVRLLLPGGFTLTNRFNGFMGHVYRPSCFIWPFPVECPTRLQPFTQLGAPDVFEVATVNAGHGVCARRVDSTVGWGAPWSVNCRQSGQAVQTHVRGRLTNQVHGKCLALRGCDYRTCSQWFELTEKIVECPVFWMPLPPTPGKLMLDYGGSERCAYYSAGQDPNGTNRNKLRWKACSAADETMSFHLDGVGRIWHAEMSLDADDKQTYGAGLQHDPYDVLFTVGNSAELHDDDQRWTFVG